MFVSGMLDERRVSCSMLSLFDGEFTISDF